MSQMPRRIKLELEPRQAMQYMTMFAVLDSVKPLHSPTFQALFLDMYDKLMESCQDQLTLEQIKQLTREK